MKSFVVESFDGLVIPLVLGEIQSVERTEDDALKVYADGTYRGRIDREVIIAVLETPASDVLPTVDAMRGRTIKDIPTWDRLVEESGVGVNAARKLQAFINERITRAMN